MLSRASCNNVNMYPPPAAHPIGEILVTHHGLDDPTTENGGSLAPRVGGDPDSHFAGPSAPTRPSSGLWLATVRGIVRLPLTMIIRAFEVAVATGAALEDLSKTKAGRGESGYAPQPGKPRYGKRQCESQATTHDEDTADKPIAAGSLTGIAEHDCQGRASGAERAFD